MIRKEITFDGKNYIVGFKKVGSSFKCIECHILKKTLFSYLSIYSSLHGKGLVPDYKYMAMWTIMDYEKECEQKGNLLMADWS